MTACGYNKGFSALEKIYKSCYNNLLYSKGGDLTADELKIIAKIHTVFPEKFGIPRQSGMADTKAYIVFEPEYRVTEAVRGLDGFSHIWVLWKFSESVRDGWSPTVRPPRLGGNRRMGVFATRSPFRPNSIGLSSLKLERVDLTDSGPVLYVSGADMLDGTPIYDIKPYLAFTDSHPDAVGGFTDGYSDYKLNVVYKTDLGITDGEKELLTEILSFDPRPSYQDDPDRIYGLTAAGFDVKFTVSGDTLTVTEVKKQK